MAVFAENRKAHFNYELLDTYECGIELLGSEVKAVRAGKLSLDGSHAIVRGGEVYILGMRIDPYQSASTLLYEPTRTRKVLLHKKEISELARYSDERGLTLVPVSLYSKGRTIKLSLAVGKGKKKSDKRETIKKRETDREIRRELKGA